jgi:hypothetical protein
MLVRDLSTLFRLLTNSFTVWDSKPEQKGSPINWVELKTSAEIRNAGDMENFNRKLMKYWIQSFLLGVPRIVVGFRTRDGILVEAKDIETHRIPEMVNAYPNPKWNADMCVNFAAAFLDCRYMALFLKRTRTLMYGFDRAHGEHQ